MTAHPFPPAQARELAAAADELAGRIAAAEAALCADGDEHRRQAGFRLADAAGECRRVAAELHATAGDLAWIAAVPAAACGLAWGVCPEHGNTLVSSGGQTWCRTAGCGRRWGYDRLGGPCPEPVTHAVTDADGVTSPVCDGHAVAARDLLVHGTVVALGR